MAINNGNVFSLLPIEVLLLIICQLPLLDALTFCSFLAASNQLLWRSSTMIELDETHFTDLARRRQLLRQGRISWAAQIKRIGRMRFVQFVNTTLPLLVSPIFLRFSLRVCYQPEYDNLIKYCLMSAIAKNTAELILDCSDEDPLHPVSILTLFSLPQFMSNHGRAIRKMSLTACCVESFSFHSFTLLTSLVLKQVAISTNEIKDLTTNCPLLQELSLLDCIRLLKIEISSPEVRLEKLIVKDCDPLSLGIEVSAPTLRSFYYSGNLVGFQIRNLASIDYVGLDYGLDTASYYQSIEVRDILQSFIEARVMNLCSFVFMVYHRDYNLFCEPPLHFANLEHLTLKSCSEAYELPGIYFLLGSLPSLQTLNILCGLYRDITEEYTDLFFPRIPEGLEFPPRLPFTNLKMVKVDGFTASKTEIDILKFLLKNAGFLEKVIIAPRNDWIIDVGILDVDIASPNLQIILI